MTYIDPARAGLKEALLRWHMAQLSREDIGLPPKKGRRRKHGLTVDDIVEAVLCLTEARHVTGEVLHVDAGANIGKW